MMGTNSYPLLSNCCFSSLSVTNDRAGFYGNHIGGNSLLWKLGSSDFHKHQFVSLKVRISKEDIVKSKLLEENRREFRWVEIGHDTTEAQKQAISQLPFKMEKRCKALMRRIICFSPEKGNMSDLLGAWVRIMKPIRADWLSVLKELKTMDHPFYLQVAEHALVEESFEANARDYTKIIHYYGKQNRLQDAENLLTVMKQRGFICDQVTLTTMVHMYSKADHLQKAMEYFEEITLLGEPLDQRSYGSVIMAYIRAGMPRQAESLLKEMDAQEIHAGSEVYKALLRGYSMAGDTEGAERVFDAIQLAGICPDDKMCGLVINAYGKAGQSRKARIAFENMRRAGIEASDKCIALVLVAYEKENKLNEALGFLMDLERDGIVVQKEGSEILARWFRKLGVVEEVELVLRDFAGREASVDHASKKNSFLKSY
ncbi:pentatricopeptide repeat-containing protein At1g01970-like [Neltuma alba]|uniref:pentatricopeptide repeat-containing protein At1g01970-like n=1 Tax=Neltuma alba TaxID=207710 RepID=UPI0010A4A0CE|nr:pentatricopeptide repeat-containing protein At1g01970-like [Prosopis alba]XP_028791191.1 pentatricopeptide repeat-containing protein At1g01970-like [Prosopis alba]XP_028791197.1 pentatricopeptide repeat-containing protein At1g01970-like [Prosopis alba]